MDSVATMDQLNVDSLIGARMVHLRHSDVDALVNPHAHAVNLAVGAIGRVGGENQLRFCPVDEVVALATRHPAADAARPTEKNVLLDIQSNKTVWPVSLPQGITGFFS